MRVGIDFGLNHVDVEVPDGSLVESRRQSAPPPVADPAAALTAALEQPLRFPPLRRALTPDDHVVIVVDEHLPHREDLLPPLLAHVASAGVALTSVTLLFGSPTSQEQWLESLPPESRKIQVEVHDPANRDHLAYLATTRRGRRLYLNRTVVDADQVVVLSRRGYDPLAGYSGAEAALYPALSDEATRSELYQRLSMEVPGDEPWPVRQEANEVAWLLGAPFILQVIEGEGESIGDILGGMVETSADGERLLDARWRIRAATTADTVVASIAGDPVHHDFTDLARALGCAARVVKPDGRIVLLTQAAPELGAAAELLRESGEPEQVLRKVHDRPSPEMIAAFYWASAVSRASIYLLSGINAEAAEELFTTPLEHPGQVQRLLAGNGSCLFLPDAHKTLAVPDEEE